MSKIESGSIFRFKIPFDLGFGYAKMIDFCHVSKYFGITIKVYDYFEKEEIKDVEFFKNNLLFMNPLPIVKMPSIQGKYAWKKIGVLKEEHDELMPIYKQYIHDGFAWETIEEYQNRQWYSLVNLNEKIGPFCFDKVRHLEELFWRSTVTVEERVAMQLLRYKSIDVKNFFTKHCVDDIWKVDYNTQQFIPLYKTLPDPIKGKPLVKGYVPDEFLDWSW